MSLDKKILLKNQKSNHQCIEEIEVDDDNDSDKDEDFPSKQEFSPIQNTVNHNNEIVEKSVDEEFIDIPLPIVDSKLLNIVLKTVPKKKKVKRLNCDICKISYHSNYALHQHISVYHKNINLSCSWCFKPFGSNADLARHNRIHTGERPYGCVYCSKSFNVSSNCLRHMRRIHNYKT